MIKVPLYLQSIEEQVMLPVNRSFIIDVPQDLSHLFNTVEKEGKEWVIVGIVDTIDPMAVLSDLNELEDGQMKSIGTLCEVINREVSTELSFIAVTLIPKTRVHIKEIEYDCGEEDPFTIWVKLDPVVEEYSVDENILDLNTDVIDVINKLVNAKELWEKPGEEAVKEIRSAKCPLDSLAIAGAYLLKDESRYKFSQTLSNIDRVSILQKKLNRILAGEKGLDGTKRKKALQIAKKSTKEKLSKMKPLTWKQKIESAELPNNVREALEYELVRLNSMPKGQERSQVEDYLRQSLSLPWGKQEASKPDLHKLIDALNETHYGLDEVKNHVLELMCEQQIRGTKGTVLCFVGPPGTGKTSIAKAIAKVANRPLSQIALGGVTDTTELLGHRRTYLGAHTGRLVSSIKKNKSFNTLFLLDELDKLTAVKGDPSSVLLEVLDPRQNDQFIDHYLGFPVDLSSCMFICTANEENGIPSALRDRLEFIRFRKYNYEERFAIITKHLLPSMIKPEDSISFNDKAIEELCKIKSIRTIERVASKAVRHALTSIHVYGNSQFEIESNYIQKEKKNYQTQRIPVGFR